MAIGLSATGIPGIRRGIDSYTSSQTQLREKPEETVQKEGIRALLQEALTLTQSIDVSIDKAWASNSIAQASDQLAEVETAQSVLQEALTATASIDDPEAKARALGSIAAASGQLADKVLSPRSTGN